MSQTTHPRKTFSAGAMIAVLVYGFASGILATLAVMAL